MTEPTLSEMAFACSIAADSIVGTVRDTLRAAARTLRAMQAQEQSAGQYPPSWCPFCGAKPGDDHDLGCGNRAPPSPSEDALLAEKKIQKAISRVHMMILDAIYEDEEQALRTLVRAFDQQRDRIAAERIATFEGDRQATALNRALDHAAAAAARAQRAEDALKPLADATSKVLDRYDAKSTIWQDLWEPWKAANAALAQPEPERKDD